MSTRKYRKKNNRKTRKKIQGDPNTFLKNLKDVKKVQHSLLRRRSRKRIKMRGGNNNDGSSKIKKREELYEKRKTRKKKIKALIAKINEEKKTKWTEALINDVYEKNQEIYKEEDLKSWNIKNQEDKRLSKEKQNDKDNFIDKLSICLKYDKPRAPPDNEDIERYGPHLNEEKKVEPGTLNAKQALACAYWSFHDKEGEELKIKNNSKTSIATGVYFPPSFLEAAGYQYDKNFNIEGKNENLKKLDEAKKAKKAAEEAKRAEEEAKRAANADKINPNIVKAFNEYKQNMKGNAGLEIGSYVRALPVKNFKSDKRASSSYPLFQKVGDKKGIKGYQVYGIVIGFLKHKKFQGWKKSAGEECLILYKIFKNKKLTREKNMKELKTQMQNNFHATDGGEEIDVTIAPKKYYGINAVENSNVEWWKKLDDLQIGICKDVLLYESKDANDKKSNFIKWWEEKIQELWIHFLSKWKSPVNAEGKSRFVFDSDNKFQTDTNFSFEERRKPKYEQSIWKLRDTMTVDFGDMLKYETYVNGDVKRSPKETPRKDQGNNIKKAFNELIEKLKQQSKNTNTTKKFDAIKKELEKLQNIFPSINLLFSHFVSVCITHNIKTNYQRSTFDKNDTYFLYEEEEEAIREFIINYPKIEEKSDSQLKLEFYTEKEKQKNNK